MKDSKFDSYLLSQSCKPYTQNKKGQLFIIFNAAKMLTTIFAQRQADSNAPKLGKVFISIFRGERFNNLPNFSTRFPRLLRSRTNLANAQR